MITWNDIKNYNIQYDYDYDEYYVDYGDNMSWSEKKDLIIKAFKSNDYVHPQIQQDIGINLYDTICFIGPQTMNCKKYLFTATSEELWKVIDELNKTNDGYEFILERNGYIHYERKHNGIWY